MFIYYDQTGMVKMTTQERMDSFGSLSCAEVSLNDADKEHFKKNDIIHFKEGALNYEENPTTKSERQKTDIKDRLKKVKDITELKNLILELLNL